MTIAGCITQHLQEAGLDVRPLPRIADGTAADLRRSIADRTGPVVFDGLIDQWPARTTWTPEQLSAALGEHLVTALMVLPTSEPLLPRDQSSYARTLRFADFLEQMLAAPKDAPCYLAYTRTESLLPSTDYDFEQLLSNAAEHGTDTRVWIGSAGTRSMLHSDLKDNVFCQIWGVKEVLLIPREHSRAAYPFPNNLVNSSLDLATVDAARFPKLRSATIYGGTLAAGDLLYIPRGCWHDFRSISPSISLNHWFGPGLSFRHYAAQLAMMGPRHWAATAVDFVRHGVLRRPEPTRFLFSPPSTGKRLYDAIRWGDFSRSNDPALEGRPSGPPPRTRIRF